MNRNFLYLARVFWCVVLICLVRVFPALGQKYTFAHYDIDDGLIQSQVNRFAMDNDHRLWIATFGGACRFDGKEFLGYSRQNGLPNNYVSTIFSDHKGQVWFGTLDGLAMLSNGKIRNYKPVTSQKHNIVTDITQDGNGTVWAVMSYGLFKITGNKMEPVTFADSSKVTTIAIDKTGRLYAAVYGKGIYTLTRSGWVYSTRFSEKYEQLAVRKILFDKFDTQKAYLLTWKGLFYTHNEQVMPYAPTQMANVKGQLLCIEQDKYKNIWVGTDNGAYCIMDGEVIHYNSSNGLTDISIADIYVDADNNIWLGSLGNGLYRCEGSRYVTFDGTQGLPESKIIIIPMPLNGRKKRSP